MAASLELRGLLGAEAQPASIEVTISKPWRRATRSAAPQGALGRPIARPSIPSGQHRPASQPGSGRRPRSGPDQVKLGKGGGEPDELPMAGDAISFSPFRLLAAQRLRQARTADASLAAEVRRESNLKIQVSAPPLVTDGLSLAGLEAGSASKRSGQPTHLLPQRPAKFSWSRAQHLSEMTRQVALVSEAGRDRDFRQGKMAARQHILGSLDTLLDDVVVWCVS